MPRGWERGRGTQGPAWKTRDDLAKLGVDVDEELAAGQDDQDDDD